VGFALRGAGANRAAVGAVVEVRAGDRRLLRQVAAGEGYFSSHDKRVLFGLGAAAVVDVAIRWPSGASSEYAGIAADRWYEVHEAGAAGAPRIRALSGR